MECPSCGAGWRTARYCGQCGELLDVRQDVGPDGDVTAHAATPEAGRPTAPLPRRLLYLGLGILAVAAGTRVAAHPPADQTVEPPPAAIADGDADGGERPLVEARRSPAFPRETLDCSPTMDQIVNEIVRQMWRSGLLRRVDGRLCLVLTDGPDTIPPRTAADTPASEPERLSPRNTIR
ncbi:MAG: hypothetical protein ACRDUY_01070 [Nitriliruptorales bacterium]